MRASVLYVDRESGALQAWDDITLGGLGLVSAKIERKIYAEQFPEAETSESSPSASPPGASPGRRPGRRRAP